MKHISFPNSDLKASNIVSGFMRIAEKSDQQIRDLVSAARDAGVNYFDHADIYGNRMHECEERFGEALNLSSSEREDMIIQTKTGILPHDDYYDLSYEHITSQVEGSLRALRTDYIDVLLLHRPDALVEPDEVARAFDELHSAGKVRNFGVSNHTPGQIDLLRASLSQPLVVNQMQLSITHSPTLAQGIAANMLSDSQSAVRDGGGLVEYCRQAGITIQAWSPFQGGTKPGTLFNRDSYPELNNEIDSLASTYDVPKEAIATAWITRHPADMQVVLGTTTPARVRAATAGSDLPLTRAEWYRLAQAGGWSIP